MTIGITLLQSECELLSLPVPVACYVETVSRIQGCCVRIQNVDRPMQYLRHTNQVIGSPVSGLMCHVKADVSPGSLNCKHRHRDIAPFGICVAAKLSQ